MKKHRYILCLLLCGFMLYYAVPYLSVMSPGVQGIFSVSWIALALFVIAGNLTAILYFPKSAGERIKNRSAPHYRKKSRSYY